MKNKYDYFVATINKDGTFNYVTKVDNATKSFFCEEGKPAMKFTKIIAEDLLNGMTLNMYPAVIMTVPSDCISFTN